MIVAVGEAYDTEHSKSVTGLQSKANNTWRTFYHWYHPPERAGNMQGEAAKSDIPMIGTATDVIVAMMYIEAERAAEQRQAIRHMLEASRWRRWDEL